MDLTKDQSRADYNQLEILLLHNKNDWLRRERLFWLMELQGEILSTKISKNLFEVRYHLSLLLWIYGSIIYHSENIELRKSIYLTETGKLRWKEKSWHLHILLEYMPNSHP